MTDRIIAVGGPSPLAPKSQARKCSECGELAYFTPETFKRMAEEQPGLKPTFFCLDCVPDEDIVMMPFNAEQIAQIHAAGFDMTGDQINEYGRKALRNYTKRKR